MAETQFDRERMLLGDEAMQVLAASHVAVFGVGGVGSFAAEALARAGVGAITLVDHDTVSLTNLNRQLVALHSTIGMRKTDVMASRILDINPACRVTNLPVFYEPECREDFFSRGFDYIADCIDSTRSKLDLIETAIRRGVPIISSMGTGNRLDPSKFRITDLSKTSGKGHAPGASPARHQPPHRACQRRASLKAPQAPRSAGRNAHAAWLRFLDAAVCGHDDRRLHRPPAACARAGASCPKRIKTASPGKAISNRFVRGGLLCGRQNLPCGRCF